MVEHFLSEVWAQPSLMGLHGRGQDWIIGWKITTMLIASLKSARRKGAKRKGA
jgi:hypothetical protein